MFENENLSEKNQEVAGLENNNEDINALDNEGEKDGGYAEHQQANNDNAKFAAARRKAENEANLIRERMERYANKRGFKSFDELERAADENEKAKVFENFQNETGLEPEAFKELFDNILMNNPDIIEAKKIVETNKMAEAQKYFDEQISKISQFDSSIKSFSDIVNMPEFEEFDKLVNKGYTMVDAYKLVNFEKVTEINNKNARQSILNNVNSKSHLAGNKGGSGAAIAIPKDVEDMYRQFNPGITEDEMRKDYEASLKRDGLI